jgi:hypothetical protein
MMRFIPRDRLDLEAALDLLPDDMPVEVDPSIGFSAATVAALRLIDPIPADIVVGIPKQRMPDSVVRVDKI